MKRLVILSGGLDSATTMWKMRALETQHDELAAVTFTYGQKHYKETQYAKMQCDILDVPLRVIDMTIIGGALSEGGSSLMANNDEQIPTGAYAQENIVSTVVPGRNLIFIAVAAGYAQAIGAKQVWMGIHSGDHDQYDDTTPEFFEAAREAVARSSGDSVSLFAPYIFKTKINIAEDAYELSVPINCTWSCYRGGEAHCGECGTCVERFEALHQAKINIERGEDALF